MKSRRRIYDPPRWLEEPSGIELAMKRSTAKPLVWPRILL
jgi:hypothetical protein